MAGVPRIARGSHGFEGQGNNLIILHPYMAGTARFERASGGLEAPFYGVEDH